MAKKIIIVSLILILSIGIIIGVSFVDTSKGSVYLKNANIVADVNTDGSLDITETWVVKFGEDTRNLYKTFNLNDTSSANVDGEVINVSATYDGELLKYNEGFHYTNYNSISSSDYGSYYVDNQGSSKYELGFIFSPTASGTKTFVFSYTLTNVVTAYNDVADFYWQAFGADFSLYIKDLSVTVNLPEGATSDDANILAFYHCENAYSEYNFSGNSVVYTAKRVSAETLVEPRILLPLNYFNQTAVNRKLDLNKRVAFIAYEQNLIDEWKVKVKEENTRFILDIVISALVLGLSAGLAIFLNLMNRRVKGEHPEYVREIPTGWSAAELGIPFYYYDGGIEAKKLRGRILSATVLELSRRDYIKIEPTARVDDDDYTIEICEVTGSQSADLKPHERTLLGLLTRARSFAGHAFTMDEFEKYAKKNYSTINTELKTFIKQASAKFEGGGYKDKFSGIVKWEPRIGMLLLIIGAFMFAAATMTFTPIGVICGGVMLIVGTPKVMRLNKKGEDIYETAHGLKRFLLDFSNMKEYEVPHLVLWEEYLVYATMMGISEQVVKQLKLVYPELSEPAEPNIVRSRGYVYTYIWLSTGRRGGFGGNDFGSRMDSALTRINNSVVNLSRPKGGGGSGGGFGGGFGRGGGGVGGGGGGFGGGGGGARR